MEFRIEKRTLALVSAMVLLAPAIFAQTEFRYDALHVHPGPPHLKKGEPGSLFITSSGILFEERYPAGKRPTATTKPAASCLLGSRQTVGRDGNENSSKR